MEQRERGRREAGRRWTGMMTSMKLVYPNLIGAGEVGEVAAGAAGSVAGVAAVVAGEEEEVEGVGVAAVDDSRCVFFATFFTWNSPRPWNIAVVRILQCIFIGASVTSSPVRGISSDSTALFTDKICTSILLYQILFRGPALPHADA